MRENAEGPWELCIQAPAKLNLSLDVRFKRPDGYHELSTVMLESSLCDRVYVRRTEEAGVRVEASAPLPAENSLTRAARLYLDAFAAGFRGGLHIHVEKRIPSEAGLGGASADAAALLRGMESLFGAAGEEKALYGIARRVGADVPFCLHGGLALCEGIGERITALPPAPALRDAAFLLVKGRQGVSTPALFQTLRLPVRHPDTAGLIAALAGESLAAAAAHMRNALAEAACALAPEIAQNRARLLDAGALAACMTGSGACVFGLFASPEAAEMARTEFTDLPFAAVCLPCSAAKERKGDETA